VVDVSHSENGLQADHLQVDNCVGQWSDVASIPATDEIEIKPINNYEDKCSNPDARHDCDSCFSLADGLCF